MSQDDMSPPYTPYTQLTKQDVLRLLNINLSSGQLWPYLEELGITVRGICGHRSVSYGDLAKKGLIRAK